MSEKQAWTPGPWRAGTYDNTGEIIVAPEWRWEKSVADNIDTMGTARLISKAPEMAKLLRRWEKSERTETNDVNLLNDTERLLADLETK